MTKYTDFNIPVVIAGVKFRNPFYVSSGPTTMTIEQVERIQQCGWGGASLKLTIDPVPYINRRPRYGYYPNKNFLSFTAEKRLLLDELLELIEQGRKRAKDLVLFSNITYSGDKGLEGWVNMAKKCEEAGAHINELNMCCPNMSFNVELTGEDTGGPKTGASLGKNEQAVAAIVKAIREETTIPLWVKITAEGSRQAHVAKVALDAGVDVCCANPNRLGVPPIDIENPTKSMYHLQKEIGMACMNGEWLKPLALRDMYEMRKMCGPDVTLAGTGGITTWQDAVEMMMCGADLIGICTATLVHGFGFMPEFIHGFKQYMKQNRYKHPRDMRDILVPAITSAPDLTIYPGNAHHIDCNLAAPCRYACPASVPAQDYVRAVARGDFRAAYDAIATREPMQAICAKICPAPCEDECTRGDLDEPVRIRDIKRFVMEVAKKNKWTPNVEKAAARKEKIAVVGSGPAGLSAARDLALAGYQVTVYEARDKAGGLLRTAIPEFRLTDKDINYEVNNVKRLGVEFRMNTALGKQVKLKQLQKEYNAVLLAVGADAGLKLGIKGEDADGYYTALDFLRQVEGGSIKRVGKNVMVIGAGDTGMDIARTARRLGAKNVLVAEIMDKDDLRKSTEVVEAVEEGVKLLYLNSVTGIVKRGRKVTGVKVHPYALGNKKDGSGLPEPVKGTDYQVAVDMVINAIGQRVPISLKNMGLKCGRRGVVVTNEATGKTNIKGVFAAGDVANQQGTIIEAVAQAKNAAAAIDKMLAKKAATLEPLPKLTQVDKIKVLQRNADVQRKGRVTLNLRKAEQRVRDFKDFTRVLTEAKAVEEAERCLACGCGTGCGICVDICKMFVWQRDVDKVVLDEDECVACGMCIWRCPNNNVEMTQTGTENLV